MEDISVTDFVDRPARALRYVRRGRPVRITSRGCPVAHLVPPGQPTPTLNVIVESQPRVPFAPGSFIVPGLTREEVDAMVAGVELDRGHAAGGTR